MGVGVIVGVSVGVGVLLGVGVGVMVGVNEGRMGCPATVVARAVGSPMEGASLSSRQAASRRAMSTTAAARASLICLTAKAFEDKVICQCYSVRYSLPGGCYLSPRGVQGPL